MSFVQFYVIASENKIKNYGTTSKFLLDTIQQNALESLSLVDIQSVKWGGSDGSLLSLKEHHILFREVNWNDDSKH